jgi:hypothetical protein
MALLVRYSGNNRAASCAQKRITLKLQELSADKMVDQWLINVASGTSVWHPRG